MQSPTTTNEAVRGPTFGEIVGVCTPQRQWISPGKTTFRSVVSPLPGKHSAWLLEPRGPYNPTDLPHSCSWTGPGAETWALPLCFLCVYMLD